MKLVLYVGMIFSILFTTTFVGCTKTDPTQNNVDTLYVDYNLDGVEYHISGMNTQLVNANLVSVQIPHVTAIYADGGTNYISFAITATSVGIHKMGLYCGVRVGNMADVNLTSASTVTYTEYGNVNEVVAGTFNIYFVGINTGNHHVSGSFRVKRIK